MAYTTTDLHGTIFSAIVGSRQETTTVVVNDIVNSLLDTPHVPVSRADVAAEVVRAAIGSAVQTELSTRGVVGIVEARTIAEEAVAALRTAAVCAEGTGR